MSRSIRKLKKMKAPRRINKKRQKRLLMLSQQYLNCVRIMATEQVRKAQSDSRLDPPIGFVSRPAPLPFHCESADLLSSKPRSGFEDRSLEARLCSIHLDSGFDRRASAVNPKLPGR